MPLLSLCVGYETLMKPKKEFRLPMDQAGFLSLITMYYELKMKTGSEATFLS